MLLAADDSLYIYLRNELTSASRGIHVLGLQYMDSCIVSYNTLWVFSLFKVQH